MKTMVSVIMPAYNGAKYIKQAVDSIVNQTMPEWELIIVDDCSMDNTLEILSNYTDERIRIYKNDRNMGISYSTNRAINLAKGKYLALLDDDDIAASDRLELQSSYLENHPDIDVLGGRAIDINENGDFLKYEKEPLYNPQLIRAYMHFVNRRFSNGTTTIRKEFYDNNHLKFKDGYYGMQDFKFIADCSKVGKISSIDKICQYKRIHKDEASFTYDQKYMQAKSEAYSNIIRESIVDSGFKLDNAQMNTVINMMSYPRRTTFETKEVKKFIFVLADMIEQCRRMETDYAEEFEYVCKRILTDYILVKVDYLELLTMINNDE